MESEEIIATESQPKKSSVGLGIAAGGLVIILLLVAVSVILSAPQDGDSDATDSVPYEETQAFAESQKFIEERDQERKLEAIQACETLRDGLSESIFSPDEERLSQANHSAALLSVIRAGQIFPDALLLEPHIGLSKLESSMRSYILAFDSQVESVRSLAAAELVANLYFTVERCGELGVQLG
jgi:hypothetical protein